MFSILGDKDTIKWAKMQAYLQFSEREYLKLQVKDTIKWAKMQAYLQFSEREYLKLQVKDTIKWAMSQIFEEIRAGIFKTEG